MERARGLAGVRRSGRLESRDGGNEGAITPISVHDHQLGSSGLQCGDGDGELGAAVVRLVYSGQHAEHGRAPPARAARRSAPQAAHVFHELRKLGYKAAVGWVVRAPAAGDEAIYDAYMREAGATGRTEAAIARLQRWRREHSVMWVSELFRADGARRCEPDTIRLCNIAFGCGRGPGNQSNRPRVGLPTPAAWDVVSIGSYVWHDGALGRVRTKGHAGGTIAGFTAGVTPRRVTARTNVKFAMSDSEVLHYDSPPLLVDTTSPTTSGCVHVRHHEIQALRAVETHVICPADPRLETTCSADLSPQHRRLARQPAGCFEG